MEILFAIFVIGLAISTMVLMMTVVMREKHAPDAYLRYRRSPWDEPVAPAEATDHPDAPAADAGTPAAHAPVTEDEPAGEQKPD